MSHTKILINTKALTLEIEGPDDFVRTYLDKLMPIIERAGKQEQGQLEERTEAAGEADQHVKRRSSAHQTAEPLRRRTRARAKGEGPSCRQNLVALRDSHFFDERRRIVDITNEVQRHGGTYTLNQVGAALSTMIKRAEIERVSVDGTFRYFWKAS